MLFRQRQTRRFRHLPDMGFSQGIHDVEPLGDRRGPGLRDRTRAGPEGVRAGNGQRYWPAPIM